MTAPSKLTAPEGQKYRSGGLTCGARVFVVYAVRRGHQRSHPLDHRFQQKADEVEHRLNTHNLGWYNELADEQRASTCGTLTSEGEITNPDEALLITFAVLLTGQLVMLEHQAAHIMRHQRRILIPRN